MRVKFAFTVGQTVTINSTCRNGTVQQLSIDLAREQSAQVKHVDDAGRVVLEWFPESALSPAGA
ncbi:MAG TPA: hypothetical protein VHN11_01550 [Xanthobacteraceae bacterium]|jgi:hypothetical protein|nr:hypothetical protein [Xanthobacteraceae bacterium]